MYIFASKALPTFSCSFNVETLLSLPINIFFITIRGAKGNQGFDLRFAIYDLRFPQLVICVEYIGWINSILSPETNHSWTPMSKQRDLFPLSEETKLRKKSRGTLSDTNIFFPELAFMQEYFLSVCLNRRLWSEKERIEEKSFAFFFFLARRMASLAAWLVDIIGGRIQ